MFNKKITIEQLFLFYKKYPEFRGKIEVETQFGYKPVIDCEITAIDSPVIKFKTKNGNILKTSPDHLIFTNTWTKVNNLKIGDKILSKFGFDEICDIKRMPYNDDLFDIEVADVHEYYSNNIVSHNSALVDGFFFSLFGETLKDLKKDEIVNNINGKDTVCRNTFEVIKDGILTQFTIERGLAPSYCKLSVNGNEDKTLSTIPATNNQVKNILASTPTIFKNLLTMAMNKTIPFMAQKKLEKRAFIEGILQLEIFKHMTDITRNDFNDLTKDYDNLIIFYTEQDKNLAIYKENSSQFEKERVEKIRAYIEKINNAKTNIEEHKNKLVVIDEKEEEEVNKTYAVVEASIAELTASLNKNKTRKAVVDASIDEVTQNVRTAQKELLLVTKQIDPSIKGTSIEYKDKISALELDIQTINNNISKLSANISMYSSELKKIQEMGNMCISCKRPYSDESIKQKDDRVAELTKLVAESKTELVTIETSKKDKQKTLAEYKGNVQILDGNSVFVDKKNAIETLIISYADKLKVLYAEINTVLIPLIKKDEQEIEKQKKSSEEIIKKRNILLTNISNNKQLNENIRLINTFITDAEKEKESISRSPNRFSELVVKTEAKLLEYKNKIATLKGELDYYNVIKFVVSEEGLKAYIIKKRLSFLNERISYYLKKMEANCTLTFNEYFEDTIINDRGLECSYFSFSNGEQKRIDLAIIFSFMDLRRNKGDVGFNLVFYDELLDSALSANGSEKVFEILNERLTVYGESSYIVTHKKENLKSPYITKVFNLEKIGGFTRLLKT